MTRRCVLLVRPDSHEGADVETVPIPEFRRRLPLWVMEYAPLGGDDLSGPHGVSEWAEDAAVEWATHPTRRLGDWRWLETVDDRVAAVLVITEMEL